MKAFRIILSILTASLLFGSCNKGNSDQGEYFDYEMFRPWVEATPDFTNIWEPTDTEVTYNITCSRDWTCTIIEAQPWIKDYTTSGKTGTSTLTVHMEQNTSTESRYARFKFCYDQSEDEIFLEQAGIEVEEEEED